MKASDSNRKIRPQKGSGRARLGRRRAPGRFGGVKKHGRKQKMYDIEMPLKVRLLALKTALSAKLSEGKVIIVDNDTIPERKTKHIGHALENFSDKETYLFVTGGTTDEFKIASQNIRRINYVNFDSITVSDAVKFDKIMFTLDGILNLMKFLHEKTFLRYRPQNVRMETPLVTESNDLKLALNPEKRKKIVQVHSC